MLLASSFLSVSGVGVSKVHLLSDSNKTEYILHGEGATITCHYILDPTESVTAIYWMKDGKEVYIWRLGQKPLPMGVLRGRVNENNLSTSTIEVKEAHMDMHGTYTCKVITNKGMAQNEKYIMVIVDACMENSWKTHRDMIACRETINFQCVGMFPKPSPACGIFSESRGSYLSSVPFDQTIQLPNGTYSISLNRVYGIQSWVNHTDITFRCYVFIQEKGCPTDSLAIQNGYYNITEGNTCWGLPKEGIRVTYHCFEHYTLSGPPTLLCQSGFWVSEITVSERKYPLCSNSHMVGKSIELLVSVS
ncbi:uncharacterized protein LOC106472833 isoform X3 [Limulus polyphemus]|uniref:Uncharacterized protein LOC106472833 isoform X3 n=1 Tax=Limulus polyphemus TaxID=6850 RepID=A0ABM1BUK0_LIMPO|nr:uncharacterized protein LOC106472833 isoform X3 [Limulus polyphemus]